MVEFRYIDWTDYGKLVAELTDRIRSRGQTFDLIIGIARGGIPVAMVIADQLEVQIDFINVKSYTGVAAREKPRIISTLTEDVKGKRVLVVDDLIDEGDTMSTVLAYLKPRKPESLNTAVLVKHPWSNHEPYYFLEVLDKWVVFPWELAEVRRLAASTAADAKRARAREIRSP